MNSKEINILYVEDDTQDIEIFSELLIQIGIIPQKYLTTATTISETLIILEDKKFDVIFLDLNLPNSNGLETYNKISAKSGRQPIIVMSGLKDLALSTSVVSRGAQDYLVKGDFNSELLYRTMIYAIERKSVQQKLHESEERFNLATEYAEVGIWDWDVLEDNIYFSDIWKNQIGYLPDELEDDFSTWKDLLHPEDHDKMMKAIFDYLENPQETFLAEFRLKHKNGHYVWIKNSANSYKDETGKVIRMLGAHINITKNKEYEEQIKLHKEHIKLINKILLHDITNNLTAIKSHVKMFKLKNEPDNLIGIENYISKSVQLIKRMRELESIIEKNHELKVYTVASVIKHAAEKYNRINITINGKADVMADDAIDSVIDNIIGNAIKHGKANQIEIGISQGAKMCKISFADNGCGIPDKFKEKIFEENFIYGETGGTGIGLYIVKNTMERYGGSVYIEDNKPQGTRFVLMFRMI
jgi:PAS domain S-box-containing protein